MCGIKKTKNKLERLSNANLYLLFHLYKCKPPQNRKSFHVGWLCVSVYVYECRRCATVKNSLCVDFFFLSFLLSVILYVLCVCFSVPGKDVMRERNFVLFIMLKLAFECVPFISRNGFHHVVRVPNFQMFRILFEHLVVMNLLCIFASPWHSNLYKSFPFIHSSIGCRSLRFTFSQTPIDCARGTYCDALASVSLSLLLTWFFLYRNYEMDLGALKQQNQNWKDSCKSPASGYFTSWKKF